MAKEIRHKDVVGGAISEDEYENINQHISDGGADGEIITVQADETLIAEPVNTAVASHIADADAHHSEEIADGRPEYGATTHYMIPGVAIHDIFTSGQLANVITYQPVRVVTPITIDKLAIEVTILSAGHKAYLGVYSADIDWQPITRMCVSAEISVAAVAVVEGAIPDTELQEGRYLFSLTTDGTPTLRSFAGAVRFSGLRKVLGASAFSRYWRVAAAYAILPAVGTAWDTLSTHTEGYLYTIVCNVKTP